MKSIKYFSFFLTVFLFMAFIAKNSNNNKSSDTKEKEINWVGIEKGIKMAKKKDKKVFIDVYTDWCGWCKKMDKNTFTDKKVIELMNKNFIPVKLDAESNEKITYKGKKLTKRELAMKEFGVQGYPTTVYLDSDINMISKPISAYLRPKKARMILKFYGEDIYQKKGWESFKKQYNGS